VNVNHIFLVEICLLVLLILQKLSLDQGYLGVIFMFISFVFNGNFFTTRIKMFFWETCWEISRL